MAPSFEEIFAGVKQTYENRTSSIVNDASDLSMRMSVFSNEIFKLYEQLDDFKKQGFVQTATGAYLDMHGESRGIMRKQATHSTGYVVLMRKEYYFEDVLIPKGTLFTSSRDTSLMFETTEDSVLYRDMKYTVLFVRSTRVGADTGIAAKTIDSLVTAIPSITSVKNDNKISGGCDIESDDDYRKRIFENIKKINNGLRISFYEDVARSHKQVWFAKAVLENFTNSTGEIKVYIDNVTHDINDDTVQEVTLLLNKARQVGMNVTAVKATPKPIEVRLKIYLNDLSNADKFIVECPKKLEQYVNSLGIGNKFLMSEFSKMLLELDGIRDCRYLVPTVNISVLPSEICTISACEFIMDRYI